MTLEESSYDDESDVNKSYQGQKKIQIVQHLNDTFAESDPDFNELDLKL